jgi:hypothetical protein
MSEPRELALQKIGRNVVYFQKFEGMLKLLLGSTNFKSPISNVRETLERKQDELERQSLGILSREYFKTFGKSMEHFHAVPENRVEPWLSFSFTLENEDGTLPEQKAAISFLVLERNRLIHQMLVIFDPESEENCRALIQDLDNQYEMLMREYGNLQEMLKAIYEGQQKLLLNIAKNSGNEVERD